MRAVGAAARLLAAAIAVAGAGAAAEPDEAVSLRTRVGVARADALLSGMTLEERIRGLERLAAIGTPRAVERLVRKLTASEDEVSAEERLVIVRALASRAAEPAVRRALARAAGGHLSETSSGAPPALDRLTQETAAVALARSGTREATLALAKALDAGGLAAHAATAALAAYPPKALDTLLAARPKPTLHLVRALAELADQRGFDALRALVQGGPPEVRAEAAVALTELGDYETVALAERWADAKQPTAMRIAAARILALGGSPRAARAIGDLLAAADTEDGGLALALEAPHPELVPRLESLLAKADDERAADVLAALGRAGGVRAAARLAAELSVPAHAALAANALGRARDEAATRALERALSRPGTRRIAARAATLRQLVRGEAPDGLDGVLERLLASRDAGDRAAGAFGVAVRSPSRLPELLAARDGVVARAAAGALPLGGVEASLAAVDRMLRAEGAAPAEASDLRRALGSALLRARARDRVPTAVLEKWLDGDDAIAPLSARALAERDDPRVRARIAELLASGDASIRAAAALGLSRSPSPDACGRLELAYRFETEPTVRAAVVRALSARTEKTRERPLGAAADLDPDPRVRSLARKALFGADLSEPAPGDGALLLPVLASRGGALGPGTAFVVRAASGLGAPAWVAPDGVLAVAGLPRGEVELRAILPRGPVAGP